MKLWNYIFILTGISILFALAGMNVAGLSDLLKLIGVNLSGAGLSSFSIQNSFWSKVFSTNGLFDAALSSGAIGIGSFIYTKDKSFLMIPLITSVTVYWGSVLASLVQQKAGGIGYGVFGVVLGMLGIALTVGFIQACIDYFMGVN